MRSRRTASVFHRNTLRLWFVISVIAGCLMHSASRGLAQGSDPDPVFEASGFQRNRAYFSQMPFENIDMVSGNLMLTFTDLVLPGNAGMDVRVQRTYNHNGHPKWSFGLNGIPLRVRHPDGPTHCGPTAKFPKIVTADGGEREALPRTVYPQNDPLPCGPLDSVFLTSDFWRWDRTTHRLQLPNGWTIQYSPTFTLVGNSVAYAEEVTDPFNNSIRLDWQGDHPKALWRVRQAFGGLERVVEFGTNDWVHGFPESMSFDGRVWMYSGGATALSSVTPPVGPGWSFDYSDGVRVTAPGGGETHYRFKAYQFLRLQPSEDGDPNPKIKEVNTIVVDTRDVSTGTTSGTWRYEYGHDTDGERITVTYPDGRQTIYYSGLTTKVSWENSDNGSYAIVKRILKDAGGNELEIEETDYEDLPVGDDGYAKIGDESSPTLRKIWRRGGQWFQSDYQYRSDAFGDYHRPIQVVETGNAGSRTTAFVYDYNFAGWIKDRIASQTVSSPDGGSFTTEAQFDDQTGFKQWERRHGIETTFDADSAGNVRSTTDGHNHTTSFTYEWGSLKDTTTPEFSITRTIRHDGLVESETRRGFQTTYDYDALGRLTLVRPARGHWFETVYDNQSGRWIEQRRLNGGAGSVTRFDLDGFGRLLETSNRVGVRTRRSYDVYGRKTYESQPFTGTANGRTFTYDALDRIVSVVHSVDGTLATYSYPGGLDVNITEYTSGSESRTVRQEWTAFGDPADARLAAVTDGEGHRFGYTYDAIGNLRAVEQPGGLSRSWQYFSGTALVEREVHPESGATTYDYDDGRLRSKRVADGEVFFYRYDGNDRLVFIDAPDRAHDVTMEYDHSDNRILLETPGIRSEFTYDGANNLESRTDNFPIGQPTPVELRTEFGHDLWDNLTSIRYPSNRLVTYAHDDEGRITQVTVDGTVVGQVEAHHPTGAVARLRYGNGIVESFTYDHQDRLEDWTGGPVVLGYGYDRQGNVTSVTSPDSALNQTLWYDRVDRLVEVTGFGATSYRYDPLGNREYKSAGDVNYRYHIATKHLEEITSSSGLPVGQGFYRHDDLGNLREDPTTEYDYTPFNMLERARVTLSGGGTATAFYGYDGDGIRKHRSTPEGTAYYVHGSANELLSEYELAVTGLELRRDYVYLGNRLLFSIERGTLPPPPVTVRLTSPATGERLPNDESVRLMAVPEVNVPDDEVAYIEFYRDGVLIDDVTSAPYTLDWIPNLPAGRYNLMARVVTTGGKSVTSAPVSVELFLVGRVTGVSVSPESPAVGELATITVTGNANPCGLVRVFFGDDSDGVSAPARILSTDPFVTTHRYLEAGPKTIVAEGHGDCRGTLYHQVTVRGPSATLTAPAPGAVVIRPAVITLSADASDPTGHAISRVDFYADGALVGSDSTAPYTAVWSVTSVGFHQLVAKAVNTLGTVGASAPTVIQVKAPPLIISVEPASPFATIPATVRVEGIPGCANVNVAFGDGGKDTLMGTSGQPLTGSYAWPTAGTRTITAYGLGDACPSEGTATVTVQPPPPFAISVSPASPTAHSSAEVKVTGPGSCQTVLVDYGDGASQAFMRDAGPPIANPHTWTTAGPKRITAAGQGGDCDLQAFVDIVVQPPTGVFTITANPSSPIAGTPAQIAIGGPSTCTAVTVNFGDGTSQALTNGSGLPITTNHTWSSAGTRVVSVTGTAGVCPTSLSTNLSVVAPPPALTITVNPASPTAGSPANVTIGGPSACATVNVDFGDGAVDTFMGTSGPPLTKAHTWTTPGPKTISAAGQGGDCDIQKSHAINVLAPPSVAIIAPSGGTTYLAPATISIQANAASAQGTITSVQFLANGTLIGTDTTAPYAHSWTGVATGTYSLTAKATDSAGAVRTSSAVNVVVGQPPPSTVLGITVTPQPAVRGQSATITVTGTNPCTMLWMDFGDGDWWIAPINSLPFTTTHTWASSGTYTVLARGYVTCGGEITTSVTVGSTPEPEPSVPDSRPESETPSAMDVDALADDPSSFLLTPEGRIDEEASGPSADLSDEWTDAADLHSSAGTDDAGVFVTESAPAAATLHVTLMGTGGGSVTSNPAGLTCSGALGDTCSGVFQVGQTVTLTTSDSTGTFAGWGGACSGLGACTVTLSPATLVVATFNIPPPFEKRYYHVDALGSVRAVTDTTGAVVRTHHYHPFGEGVGVGAGADPLRFTGKERDGETGLDYFGARYHSPSTGRFTTVDPLLDVESAIQNPQLWNRYAYGLNSPYVYADPDGRNPRLIHRLLQIPVVQRALGSPAIRPIVKALERASNRLLDLTLMGIRQSARTPDVWRSIEGISRTYPATKLPMEFNLRVGSASVQVVANATKHIFEHLVHLERAGATPRTLELAVQGRLSSLQAAVTQALSQGIAHRQMITTAGWELMFAIDNGKTILIHALPK